MVVDMVSVIIKNTTFTNGHTINTINTINNSTLKIVPDDQIKYELTRGYINKPSSTFTEQSSLVL